MHAFTVDLGVSSRPLALIANLGAECSQGRGKQHESVEYAHREKLIVNYSFEQACGDLVSESRHFEREQPV